MSLFTSFVDIIMPRVYNLKLVNTENAEKLRKNKRIK